MLADLRLALRALARAPGFTLAAVVCLALGIGANATVFSAVNTLLLRPLPYAAPARVMLVHAVPRAGGDFEELAYADYADLGTAGGAFAATGAYANGNYNLGGGSEPERVRGTRVTASLFPLLGLAPALGRGFRPDEDRGAPVVLLGDALWRRRFAADPRVVGRTVTVDGAAHTVVGVMPPKLRFPESSDLWVPLEPGESAAHRDWRVYQVLGRLAPDVTVDQARAQVAAFMARQAVAYPAADAELGGWVRPVREEVASQVRPMMRILLAAVGLVLLVACSNVANLVLGRAAGRGRELAVRRAVGAPRGRLVRQLLVEGLALALLGGAAGALLGDAAMRAVRATIPLDDLPFWMEFRTDGTVLLLTLAASLASVLVFALAPALRASAPDLTAALKAGGTRTATADRRTGRARSALVVGQLALSVVLLAGAALMLRSFARLATADPGFDARGVLTLQTSLQGPRYATEAARAAAYDRMVGRLRALPGVTAAGAVSELPVASCCSSTLYAVEGRAYRPGEAPGALIASVTPDYFRALGVRAGAGRAFDRHDAAGTPAAVLVDEALAARAWPGGNALGRTLRLDPAADTTRYTVVGVVGNVKQRTLTEPDRPHVYVSHAQSPWRSMTLVVRAAGDPAALAAAAARAVRAEDADLPVTRVMTMAEVVRRRNFQPRVYSTMMGVFGLAALLLAAVGLYGVVAYAVARRTPELGVRLALGARPADVRRLVLGDGARLTAFGVALGLPAAFGAARALRGALYGVGVADPATFVGVPLGLAAVALAATYLPARRASRVDPAAALRGE